MQKIIFFKSSFCAILAIATLFLAAPEQAKAHCDTLDGPVIEDARKAINAKDITPILKWVKPQDEKVVRAAFEKVLADKSKKPEVVEHKFFETLVKIHRAGEGAPFTGLKPAGTTEPAVAAADQALASGSTDALEHLIINDIVAGIKKRYEQAAATYKHKDENVAQGREFVEAYVEFTHYVERLHKDATAQSVHGAAGDHDEHSTHSQH